MLKKSFIDDYGEIDFWEEHWLIVWYTQYQIDWRSKQINLILED